MIFFLLINFGQYIINFCWQKTLRKGEGRIPLRHCWFKNQGGSALLQPTRASRATKVQIIYLDVWFHKERNTSWIEALSLYRRRPLPPLSATVVLCLGLWGQLMSPDPWIRLLLCLSPYAGLCLDLIIKGGYQKFLIQGSRIENRKFSVLIFVAFSSELLPSREREGPMGWES